MPYHPEYTADQLAAEVDEVLFVALGIDADDERIRENERRRNAEDGEFQPSSQDTASSSNSERGSQDTASSDGSDDDAHDTDSETADGADDEEAEGQVTHVQEVAVQEAVDEGNYSGSDMEIGTDSDYEDERPPPATQPRAPLPRSKLDGRMLRLIATLYREFGQKPEMAGWRETWSTAVAILYERRMRMSFYALRGAFGSSLR